MMNNNFLRTMNDEEIIKETNKIKDQTRQVGIRILNHSDDIINLASSTKLVLDDQTKSMESIIDELNIIDTKVKESKSLTKRFKSWFWIFYPSESKNIKPSNTKTRRNSHENKTEKKIYNKEDYKFDSDNPADEIADKLSQNLDIIGNYANDFNTTLKKQSPMLDQIHDGISKSDSEIKNITNKIKSY